VEILGIQMQLGWVNYHLGELNQSLVFADLALTLAKKIQLPNRVADALTLKGVAYTRLYDFVKAKNSLDQVLLIRQQLKDNSRISEAFMNLGFLEESRKNYSVARDLYEESLSLAELSKYDFGKAWSLLGLSAMAYKLGDNHKAIKLIGRAEIFSKEISANEVLVRVYELYRDLLATENNYKESLRYSMLADNLKDSLHRSDLSRRFINLQKIEEIERRDRDINVLTKDKQLAEDKISLQELKLRQQYFLIIASAIGLTLLAALAFVYARYYFRIRRLNAKINKKKIRIQDQANRLTEINNQLLDQNRLIETQKSQLLQANENLEDEVDHRTEELTRQNLQLEQFAYMTSHNLRAPVARLLGLTQLFDHNNLADPLNRLLIEKVRITAQEFDITMSDLASILEVKKGVNGNFSMVDIEECYYKAKAALNDELNRFPISLYTEFDETKVCGVEPYLISIFYHLLSNSAKFRKEDMLDINVISRRENAQVIVEYRDNGIGFDMVEAGENLFRPYKRFHLHKAGKGLGLYMIKLQVEAMGGTLVIHSEPNAGFLCAISFKTEDNEQPKLESSIDSVVEAKINAL
jgi:signal transduction histidine kinase